MKSIGFNLCCANKKAPPGRGASFFKMVFLSLAPQERSLRKRFVFWSEILPSFSPLLESGQ
jgi:hypothetical protein